MRHGNKSFYGEHVVALQKQIRNEIPLCRQLAPSICCTSNRVERTSTGHHSWSAPNTALPLHSFFTGHHGVRHLAGYPFHLGLTVQVASSNMYYEQNTPVCPRTQHIECVHLCSSHPDIMNIETGVSSLSLLLIQTLRYLLPLMGLMQHISSIKKHICHSMYPSDNITLSELSTLQLKFCSDFLTLPLCFRGT